MTDPTEPLPTLISVTQAFMARLPSQRVIDLLGRLEPGVKLGELMEGQPSRMVAFRALLRDHPDRDPTSLWLHAYDCEVEMAEVDPTFGNGLRPSPSSAPTTS
jgi:hypothetical protein